MEHEIDRIECAIRHIESSLDVDPWACEIAVNAMRELIKRTHGWIPVTEALPKEEDCPMDCLVTRKSKFIGNYTDMAVCEKNGTWTHEDWDAIVLGDVKDGKSTGLISTRDDNIIAWMPLPEPYKEGQDE